MDFLGPVGLGFNFWQRLQVFRICCFASSSMVQPSVNMHSGPLVAQLEPCHYSSPEIVDLQTIRRLGRLHNALS